MRIGLWQLRNNSPLHSNVLAGDTERWHNHFRVAATSVLRSQELKFSVVNSMKELKDTRKNNLNKSFPVKLKRENSSRNRLSNSLFSVRRKCE